MKNRSNKNIVVFLFILAIILNVYLIFFLPVEHYVDDDFYYYLGISKNFVEKSKVTFDGIEESNGFHPIFFCLLVIINLFSANKLILMKLGLCLLAIFYIATGYIIYKFFIKQKNDSVAILILIIYLFNPVLINIYLDGLESSISGFFFFLFLVYYLLTRKTIITKTNHLIALGILLGISTLARFSNLLFIPIILIDLIFLIWKNNPNFIYTIKKTINSCIKIFIPYLVVLAPWLIWSYFKFKVVLPISGDAVKLVFGGYITKTNFLILFIAFFLLVFIIACFTFKIFNDNIHFLLIAYIIEIYLFYSVYINRILPRYFYEAIIILIILFGILINNYIINKRIMKLNAIIKPNTIKLLQFIFLVIFVFSSVYVMHFDLNKSQVSYDSIQTSKWIKNNLKKNTIIGSFNAGALGFWNDDTITLNLDGVINNNAYLALKNKKLDVYVEEQNIKYIVDRHGFVQKYFNTFSQDRNIMSNLKLIKKIGLVEIYEIDSHNK